jgi:hypothetical protein
MLMLDQESLQHLSFIPSNYVTFKLTNYPITLSVLYSGIASISSKPGSKVWNVVKKVISS